MQTRVDKSINQNPENLMFICQYAKQGKRFTSFPINAFCAAVSMTVNFLVVLLVTKENRTTQHLKADEEKKEQKEKKKKMEKNLQELNHTSSTIKHTAKQEDLGSIHLHTNKV